MEWENDWPVVKGITKIQLRMTGPGLYELQPRVSWLDPFSSPQIPRGWYRKSERQSSGFSHWHAYYGITYPQIHL